MKRLASLLLMVGAITVLTVAAVTPIRAQAIDEALAQLKQDSFTGERFTFCVLGDTRHWMPIVMPDTFIRNINEMNLLDPSFIIDVGDLILGYIDSASLTHTEWDSFLAAIGVSSVPFIPIVGNHDVWDRQSQRIFKERVGPVAFSFDYGNSHFLCLTTEEPGYLGNIAPAQLRWLKEDLEAHRDVTHIFVFMHKPIWSYESNWLTEVHPLLKKYPVKAVFAGHEHLYRKDIVDEIPCIVTGGGGADLDGEPEGGGFHHFLHISVKGDQIRFAVVKTGNIESEDVVTGQVIESGQ